MTGQEAAVGEMQSPGGFVFGLQGWSWGEPRPKSITFFLDGTAKVSDQHGRPIKGTVVNNKEVRFAQGPPSPDDQPDARKALATHAEVVAALTDEEINWLKLDRAGWPQLSYEALVKVPNLPPTPLEDLAKIRDPNMRKAALKFRREMADTVAKEMAAADEE